MGHNKSPLVAKSTRGIKSRTRSVAASSPKDDATKDWGRVKAVSVRSFAKTSVADRVEALAAGKHAEATVVIKQSAKVSSSVKLSVREAAVLGAVLKKMRAGAATKLSTEKVAELVVAAIPDAGPSPWDDLIGPFYSTSSLSVLRDVSRQALQKMRQTNKVLSVTTSDQKILYPSFQFDQHGNPVGGLSDVLSVLAGTMPDGWTIALWLTSPMDSWGGQSAMDKLHTGSPSDLEDVLIEARASVATRERR